MPTATTTAILLSAYINYLAHCQSQTPVVRQIRNEAYSIRDRHAAMRKQAEQAHDAVAELRSIHAKQQALAEELRAEVNGAAPAIMALLTEKAGLEKQMKEAKDEKDDLLKQKVRARLFLLISLRGLI
jgi:capsule polysaccharide export protein KpsE/RkpR